ncbi:uncharacterized protein LOC132558017 [Ylistrum balloti]|uniref:uncharacterized protein LOC132558017 n=1 Tax=Ylistrum balloti TaxID=509963 RepID=UPI0029058C4A|nr:uncharacterized protein LOC132558017 [Ylistrum balloti]
MADIFVNIVLIILASDCFDFLNGKKFDTVNQQRPWKNLNPGFQPQHQHDFVDFVYQKFESMERQMAEKDERIDQLELKIASHETAILQKDVIIERLIRRVSVLETIESSKPFIEKNKNADDPESHLDFSTPNANILNDNRSPRNNTAILQKIFGPATSENKPQDTQFQSPPCSACNEEKEVSSKRNSIAPSSRQTVGHQEQPTKRNDILKRTDDDDEEVSTISSSRQNRVPTMRAVAFHTALSTFKTAFKTDAAVIFDHEALDNGNGYSPTEGIYIVPQSGTYVLTWTILADARQEFDTFLIVNGDVRGSSFSDTSENGDYYQSTAVVVIFLNEGDHVFIRMGYTTVAVGTIVSTDNHYGVSTFSGWKLD